jgi:hypothetical protein
LPNPVNSSVYGNTFVAPNPFLHASVEEDLDYDWDLDPNEDANGNGMLDTERDPFKTWLDANMPPGVTVEYINDWKVYHLDNGEVHCSSNEQRTIPSSPKWWE